MKIVVISDTHTLHGQVTLPAGDVLIHAGDICSYGTEFEVMRFNNWAMGLESSFKKIIVIAGNHDWFFEKSSRSNIDYICCGFTYIQDEMIEVDGVKIYGAPWQPEFCSWAFNLPRGEEIKKKWDMIPNDTDILITHGPPLGYGDALADGGNVGCRDLLNAVERVRPAYHLFGHVHSGHGKSANEHTTFINASICTEQYKPTNEPFVIEIKPKDCKGTDQ